jgi:formiminotetrahydrofolate cyclodeaminase
MARKVRFGVFVFGQLIFCFYACGQSPSDSSSSWNKTVSEVIQLTARNHPKITGGCITLTAAGLNTSLVIMALEISKVKQKEAEINNRLDKTIKQLRSKLDSANLLADYDLHVFEDYLKAGKLRDSTPALKAEKRAALQQGLIKATASPIAAAE